MSKIPYDARAGNGLLDPAAKCSGIALAISLAISLASARTWKALYFFDFWADQTTDTPVSMAVFTSEDPACEAVLFDPSFCYGFGLACYFRRGHKGLP
ncbi:MAG: hypothetical protein JKY92_03200 [Magnetovibrio sp.]|nr:hypothetical protein [Magnetovibrio sp.]